MKSKRKSRKSKEDGGGGSGDEDEPEVSEKDMLRMKLRATIEANRVARLKRDDQDEVLSDYKRRHREAKGRERVRLRVMIEIIKKKQEEADRAWENMMYDGSYMDKFEGFGGGCGSDAAGH